MKKRKGLILALVVMLVCTLPISATAANETSGSVDVTLQVPLPTPTPAPNPSAGSGGSDTNAEGTDETPSYSYIVNIPANFAITKSNNTFSISATKMDIPAGKEVVVRLDGAATFEADGNFYFYKDGNKHGEDFIQCSIARGTATGNEWVAASDALASFRPGELTPHDWTEIIMMYAYEEYVQAAEGTYSGTVYYTIGLE